MLRFVFNVFFYCAVEVIPPPNTIRVIMGFFTFFFAGLIHIIIFIVEIVILFVLLAAIIWFTWNVFISDTGAKFARNEGLSAAQGRISNMVTVGIDAPPMGSGSNSAGKAGGRYVSLPMGKQRSRTALLMVVSLMTLLTIVTPITGVYIEFGEITGRYPCEVGLQCARDNTFHEMHMHIRPPLDRDAAIAETAWLFAPWDAEDSLSTPVTCDPHGSGQCYILNQGTLRVEVEASRPYWRYELSRYPVHEFASAYKINSTVVDEVYNETAGLRECETLIHTPNLFSDNGPCWQHTCEDGGMTVVTETVGIAPGCGEFVFLHPYPRLTFSMRVHMFDVGTRRRTHVVIPDVYDGARATDVFSALHVEVHNVKTPGGRSWQPPTPLRGSLVVCDWRNTWTLTDSRGKPGGNFLNNSWYYVPPEILQNAYAGRECGMNGVALHTVTSEWTGRNCTDTLSFANGACLPSTPPGRILDGTVDPSVYTPPYWNDATQNMFIHQNARGEKMLMRVAESQDFQPGDLSYDVVLRVSNTLAMTDADIAIIPYHALCVEYDALQCIIDPVSLTVKLEGVLSNRAWQVVAKDTSLNLTCSYNDGVHASNVTLTEEFFVNVLNPGEGTLFSGLFDLPEEATVYKNGVKTPRVSSEPQFVCSVTATSPARKVQTTFKWSGTVTCGQLVRKVYQFTDDLCPCDRDAYSDMICRYEWNCNNDGVDIAFIVFASVGFALDFGVGVYFVVTIVRKKRKNAEFTVGNELTAKKYTPGIFGEGELPLAVSESVAAEADDEDTANDDEGAPVTETYDSNFDGNAR